jgi:hypothetical protein
MTNPVVGDNTDHEQPEHQRRQRKSPDISAGAILNFTKNLPPA